MNFFDLEDGQGFHEVMDALHPEANVTFAVEPWSVYAQDAEKLWPVHWLELAKDQDYIPLDVDHARYEMLDSQGKLFIVVGRQAGAVVAYWIAVIQGHMHYKDTLHAFNDIYYVNPEHRNGGIGSQMFAYVEKTLRKRGVKKITNATKISHDHGPLFEAHGFTAVETVYTKIIGD